MAAEKEEERAKRETSSSKKQVDLDDKYKSLLNKINRQTRVGQGDEESEEGAENEESVDEEDKKAND